MPTLTGPSKKFRPCLKVTDIPPEGWDGVLNGKYESGESSEFYEHYIGVNLNGTETFLGVGAESMSLAILIDAYGPETEKWEGKPVHVGSSTIKSGRYAGTACLALSIPANKKRKL
jgi:hypothetical protein